MCESTPTAKFCQRTSRPVKRYRSINSNNMEDNGNEVINFSVLVILGVLVNMHVFMKRSGGTRNLQMK